MLAPHCTARGPASCAASATHISEQLEGLPVIAASVSFRIDCAIIAFLDIYTCRRTTNRKIYQKTDRAGTGCAARAARAGPRAARPV